MSEQAKILEEMQALIMEILKSGAASAAQGQKLDALEEALLKQRCFKASANSAYENQGEEVAYLFLGDKHAQGIDKLYEYKIHSNDFIGFVNYHFDEEDDEEVLAKFTDDVVTQIHKDYEAKCQGK